jgi:glucose dehydrogenase
MSEQIRQDNITGSRRFSNYFWGIFLALGGLSFLLAGLSSYFKINLLLIANTTELVFIPQGVVMMFYGTLSLSLSIYICGTILWDIGGGYNEYNKIENRTDEACLFFNDFTLKVPICCILASGPFSLQPHYSRGRNVKFYSASHVNTFI